MPRGGGPSGRVTYSSSRTSQFRDYPGLQIPPCPHQPGRRPHRQDFPRQRSFLTWDGTPPLLTVLLPETPGSIALESDAYRSLASFIQETGDLSVAPELWTMTTAPAATQSGKLIFTVPLDGPVRFFRRKGM